MEQRKIPDNIETPDGIRLGVSQVDKRRLGSFCTSPIAQGTEFGPYKGKIVIDKNDDAVDPKFSWKVFDLTTFKYLHTVDASCPADGNWMRYVCCARYFEEQNIVSTQNGTDVYYRALKDIEAGEELLTWFEQKKKKRKRSSLRDGDEIPRVSSSNSLQSMSMETPPQSPGKVKRKRKPKIIPDAYEGPMEWEEQEQNLKKPTTTMKTEDEFEPLQPGQKRRRRKKPSCEITNTNSIAEQPNASADQSKQKNDLIEQKPEFKRETSEVFEEAEDGENNELEQFDDTDSKNASFNSETSLTNSSEGKKESSHMSIAEINNSVEWEFPNPGEEYNFELKKQHIVRENGKKVYRCDICLGLYKHMFSLKRHYLRNHINYKYISKSDMTNCLINLMQAKQQMKYKLANLADEKTFKRKPDDKSSVPDTSVDNKETNGAEATENENELNRKIDSNKNSKGTENSVLKNNTVSSETSFPLNDANTADNNDTINRHVNEDIKIKNESEDNSLASVAEANVDSKMEDNDKVNAVDNEFKHVMGQHSEIGAVKCDIISLPICENTALSSPDNVVKSGAIEDSVKDGDAKSGNKTEPGQNNDVKSECIADSSKDDSIVTADSGKDTKNKSNNIDEVNENKSLKPGLFRCYTCYLTFDDFEGIREHTQNHPEQMEGECFPCDLCSMRFNYKHNLIRHKKTHSTGADGSTSLSSSSSSIPSVDQGEGQEKVSPRKHLHNVKSKPPPAEKKPGLLPSVFRCGVCPMKFDSQPAIIKHVEEQHKNGSKFQCIYCGKDFLSMPNMKKHVRFHLGYRATCKLCSEAFSNVGALRKHTRVQHPEDYRAKLIERLQKYGVLKGPDKNALSKEVIDRVNSGSKHLKVPANHLKDPVEIVKKEKVGSRSSTPQQEKVEDIENEINFTADEIDDGGSRFKFACTVCKKRFSSYINMCRHRRKVHSHENRHRTIECLTFGRKPRVNPSPLLENPLEVAAFFANISHNIAINLNCFIDGKSDSLKTFADHIKVEDYQSFGYSDKSDTSDSFSLNKYNFPLGFKPGETISFTDIKNTHNIHNDFESHCTSAADSADVNSTEIKESAEDSEVRQINSVKDTSDTDNNTMKTSSQGFKVLGNVGSVLARKGPMTGDKGINSVDGSHVSVRIQGGVICSTDSPAAKTFNQISRGEYANFQDDMMVDMDSSLAVSVRSHSVSSTRSWNRPNYNKQGTDRVSPTVVTKAMVQSAQDEIDSLYDDIDNLDPEPPVCKQTPKLLSTLCEQVLGLCVPKKEKKLNSLTNEVATHLRLSTKEDTKNRPDFTDEPEESPFYNYDTIMFGRNGQIEQVCAICRRHFSDVDHLLRHHMKKHPASVCNFLEVENGHEIEDLHFSQPCHVGALAVTNPGLDDVSELSAYRCTNCDSSFPSMSKLHVHIVNCSSIDPLYGCEKSDRSPAKSTFRKRFQKKMFHFLGKNVKSFSDTSSQMKGQNVSSRCSKRVFTGCRKRQSVILPDSPEKVPIDQKNLSLTGSGYNPQNHVRRREFTEVLNNLTCEACGQQFKTIIILERHVKHCDKKENFKNVQPMACTLDDSEKKKNMCLYCNKNFTYTKSLLNHFQDFCPIKKAKLDKGELSELEKKQEAEVIYRINKADEEKALKQKEMDNRPKRIISWQVGRKCKRKGHSWTNIKKRNQLKAMKGGTEEFDGEEGDNDNDDDDSNDDSSESEDDVDDNDGALSGNSEVISNKNDDNDEKTGDLGDVSNNDKESEMIIDNENPAVTGDKEANSSVNNGESSEKANVKVEEITSRPNTDDSFVVKSYVEEQKPDSSMKSDVGHSVEIVAKDNAKDCDIAKEEYNGESNQANNMQEEPSETKDDPSQSDEVSDNAYDENETQQNTYSIGNTSLDCTSRYKVNQVQPAPKKYRAIRPKPALFQCIAGQSGIRSPSPSGMTGSYIVPKPKATTSVTAKSQNLTAGQDIKVNLVDSSEVPGKRRRKQVGKVEEFLKAFRRKSKKKSENPSATESNDQFVKSTVSINSQEIGVMEKSETQSKESSQVTTSKDPEPNNEDAVSTASGDDLNNSGFISFDIPTGLSPAPMVRKRGRPRKHPTGEKKIGRPPKLFPSIKSAIVPNMLKKRVGRPPKLKPVEGISIKKLNECESMIPDVMTNPALSFTHLVKNGEIKHISSDLDRIPYKMVDEKVTENYDKSRATDNGADDKNVLNNETNDIKDLNEITEKGDEVDGSYVPVNEINEDGDDNDDIDDNLSDPSTEPFSENITEMDELYEDMPNLEPEGNIDDTDCPNENENDKPDLNRSESETKEETADCNTGNGEIDGVVTSNENADESTNSKYTSETEIKPDGKDTLSEIDEAKNNHAESTESEGNIESDYKTESEFEVMTEEEDLCEGAKDDKNESLNNVVTESSSADEELDLVNHSEKEDSNRSEEKIENFEAFAKFEPILSPSERVKMNRRSCKKDVELTSPVWMKRTKLYKGKIDKKGEELGKMSEASDSDSSCTSVNRKDKSNVGIVSPVETMKTAPGDGQTNKGRKRKYPEQNESVTNKSKVPKLEMKGNTKKTVKAKK